MKSILIVMLFFFITTTTAFASPQAIHCSQGQGVAGGCGGTPTEQNTTADTISWLSNYTTNAYIGGVVDSGEASVTVCQIDILLGNNTGSISGHTFYVDIYSVSGSDLNVLQGTSSGVSGSDSWGSGGTWVSFLFSPGVVLEADEAFAIRSDTTDASNFARVFKSNSDGDSGYSVYYRWNSSGTFQLSNSNYDLAYRIYTE